MKMIDFLWPGPSRSSDLRALVFPVRVWEMGTVKPTSTACGTRIPALAFARLPQPRGCHSRPTPIASPSPRSLPIRIRC